MARRPQIFSVGSRRITSGTAVSVESLTRQSRISFAQINKNLRAVIDNIINNTPEATEKGLQPIFDLSQKYVPVDTRVLKNSGYIASRRSGKNIEAEVGYGRGGHPPYTAIVHEQLDVAHAKPTRSKFLEAAVNEKLSEVLPIIVRELKKDVGI